jgi:Zn-dependent protease
MSLLITTIVTVLLGIPAMLLHECGHIVMAMLCGVKVKKIGISRMGFYTVREPGPRWANLCVSFAGPAVNFLLAFVLREVAPTFALVNLIAAVFNLLPVPNSDGSRILGLLAAPRTSEGRISSARILGHPAAH